MSAKAAASAPKWAVVELELRGPAEENPLKEVSLGPIIRNLSGMNAQAALEEALAKLKEAAAGEEKAEEVQGERWKTAQGGL